MTLLEWVSAWWGATPAPARIAVTPMLRPTPRVPVPDEYLSLYTYLEHRYASTVVLTFEQMESLLGFALPEAARRERDWWTGVAVPPARQSEAWTVAGRTAAPNLSARTVAFERLS